VPLDFTYLVNACSNTFTWFVPEPDAQNLLFRMLLTDLSSSCPRYGSNNFIELGFFRLITFDINSILQ
jgi:hypothetical protein